MNNVKLCFLILSCIAEDQYANSLMHDANLAFRVQLHRVPMHHRKLQDKAAPAQPLAATLLGMYRYTLPKLHSFFEINTMEIVLRQTFVFKFDFRYTIYYKTLF